MKPEKSRISLIPRDWIVFTVIVSTSLIVRTESAYCRFIEESSDGTATSTELHLNRGIVLYEQGKYAEALEHFQKAQTSRPMVSRYINLCHAGLDKEIKQVAYNNEDGFCNVDCGSEVNCGSAVGGNVRPWHLTVLTGYQYDSNVTLEPEFIGLGSGRGIVDSSWLVAAFADYQLVHQSYWNLGLIGSAFTNQYFTANEFDFQDYMGGAYTNVLVTDSVMASVRYEFHESLLDYTQFATQHRLVPNVTLLEGDFGHLTAYYEYDAQEFDNTPLIPAMDRSGDSNAVGITQAIYTWGGDGRIYAGYRYERTNSDGSDFDFKTNMVTGRLECPLTQRSVFDFEYRHFWDDYDNPNSLDFAGLPRIDRRSEVRAGLQFFVNQHISIRGDYTYINSDSNTANLFGVQFFDYDRNLFSTQLIYDF